MKKKLLNILSCPNCRNSRFELRSNENGGQVITEGEIRCKRCGAAVNIKDGMVRALHECADAVRSEIKGTAEYLKGHPPNLKTILEIPDVQQGSEKEYWRPIAANFHFALDRLSINGNETVLDVGAGYGWLAKELVRRGCSAVAVDISEEMLHVAENKKIPHCRFLFSDGEKLPFADNHFDIAAAITTLEFTADPVQVIAEITRCVKKLGGRLLFGLLNALSRFN